jgi:hypothetical protein
MPEKAGEMPKEYMGEKPQTDGSIDVSWGRNCGTVRISVAGPIGWRAPLLEDVEEIDWDNQLDWHFLVRERREINQLIKLLRTARDQAFGKDE